jgi:hypothetical protein
VTAAEKRKLEAQIERAAKYEVARLVALLLRRLGQPPATIAATSVEPLNLVKSALGEKLAELRVELDFADDDLAPELDVEPRETEAPE